MLNSPLFERNLRYFSEKHPDLHKTLLGMSPRSTLVWDGDAVVDIDLGEGRFYKRPGEAFVREQLDLYFDDPERVLLTTPEGAYQDSPLSLRMLASVRDAVMERGVETLEFSPKDQVGYLLVIGVGLGLHLKELIERTRPRNVLFIEPIPEFLHQSLYAADWADLLDLCDEEGIAYRFILVDNPQNAVSLIFSIMETQGYVYLDGSYIYTHYHTWNTNAIRALFKDEVPMRYLSKGYYEDEIKMIRNAGENYILGDFRFINGEPRHRREVPAFVVGSGPSLDQSIETIKKWSGDAIVFSAGSALQPLLAAGIVPDYQVELENEPIIADKIEHIFQKNRHLFDGETFGPVKLIASATVNPTVRKRFEETYIFLRDSVSSTLAFKGPYREIFCAAPLGANTSLALAAILGFYKVYLFGVDCGVRVQGKTHTDNTVYTDGEANFYAFQDFDYQFPGNFGGTVHCNQLYDWSRRMLLHVLRNFRLEAANCSDGALIEGARPLMHTAVSLPGTGIDRDGVTADIRESSRLFAPGEFLRDCAPEEFAPAWEDFIRDYGAMLQASLDDDETFVQFFERLRDFVHGLPGRYRNVHEMVSGSMISLAHIGRFFTSRIADDAARYEVLKDFTVHYRDIMLGACEDGRTIFQGLVDRLAPRQEG